MTVSYNIELLSVCKRAELAKKHYEELVDELGYSPSCDRLLMLSLQLRAIELAEEELLARALESKRYDEYTAKLDRKNTE